jgi:hypothetical protein
MRYNRSELHEVYEQRGMSTDDTQLIDVML